MRIRKAAGKGNASQLNERNTDYGPQLNPDILENIIKTTVGRYPQMRQKCKLFPDFLNALSIPSYFHKFIFQSLQRLLIYAILVYGK